ncbi:unnamed protein product, partial [Polarella glacialis]
GIGLLGVFLATQGPSRALLTDGSPLCVSMIKANLDIADLPPELEKEAAVLPFGEMFELVDSLRGRFDVLFAADVVYNRTASVIDDLFQTAEVLLAVLPDAAFYHGYTERRPELTEALLAAADRHGFSWELIPLVADAGDAMVGLEG